MTYVLVLELREHEDLAVHAARRGRARERVRHLLERHAAPVARVRHRPAFTHVCSMYTPFTYEQCTRADTYEHIAIGMGSNGLSTFGLSTCEWAFHFWHAVLVCALRQ